MARTTRTTHRRVAIATLVTTLLLAGAGCSGDDTDPDSESASSATPSGPPPLQTTSKVGVVSGKLSKERQARVKQRVAEVVDDWIDAAYVGGDWPRTEFGDAYPHFTPGAAKDAARDAGLMSNQRIAARLDGVRATQRRLLVDLLAVNRRPAGVTARFVVAMRLSGEVERTERVAGSLFLTWREGGWKVFGYDVQRGKA